MRTPVAPDSPEEAARRRRRRLIVLALVAVAIVAGAVAAYALLQPGPPVRILSLTVSPDPGVPDQPLTVRAEIQGGSFLAPLSVMLTYESFFADPGGGGRSLLSAGGGSYSATIGPYPNGTAVWFLVAASDGRTVQRSTDLTVDVGSVGGGPSNLRVSWVRLTPPVPTPLDAPVVTANVTSTALVTDVFLSVAWFAAGGNSAGSSGGSMTTDASGNYTSLPLFLTAVGPSSAATAVGTLWVYRIGIQDSLGNVLLTPVYNFTVASP